MNQTSIEWVKNPGNQTQGITINSKTGCVNHTPEGLCLGGLFPCYAYKLAQIRLKQGYLANTNTSASLMIDDTPLNMMQKQVKAELDPFYPRFWPERLDKIRGFKKPTGIFLDDMSDWMGDYWPEEWTRQEIQVMRDCPQHRFYTLTKQSQNLTKWDFPDNCWVGVTATNAEMLYAALAYLEQIEATVKFVSLEPLLSQMYDPLYFFNSLPDYLSVIDWLIIGACTGTVKEMSHLVDKYLQLTPTQWGNKWTAQPRIEWAQEIVEAADKAGTKVFLKNNLRPLLIPEDCSKPNYLTKDIFWASEKAQLRQEMPRVE